MFLRNAESADISVGPKRILVGLGVAMTGKQLSMRTYREDENEMRHEIDEIEVIFKIDKTCQEQRKEKKKL